VPVVPNAIKFRIIIIVLNLLNIVEQRLITLVNVAVAVRATLTTAGSQVQGARTISPVGTSKTADNVTFTDGTSSPSGRKPRGTVAFVSNISSNILGIRSTYMHSAWNS
jgi:hypothetical protein